MKHLALPDAMRKAEAALDALHALQAEHQKTNTHLQLAEAGLMRALVEIGHFERSEEG